MFQFAYVVSSFSLFSEYISGTHYVPGMVLNASYPHKIQ